MTKGDTSGDRTSDLGTWRESLIALVLVGLAFVVRMALHPLFQSEYPYITFFPAAVYAAWKCRWEFSAIVVLTSAALAHWWFIPPVRTIEIANPSHVYGTSGYLAACAAIITLGELLRRKNLRLQRELAEREQAEQALVRVAQFPEQSPSPVMRIDGNGILLYHNPASQSLLEEWGIDVGRPVPQEVRDWLRTVLKEDRVGEMEQTVGARSYAFVAAPFSSLGYVNLYGRDITEQVAIRWEQVRTSERFHLLSEVSAQLLTTDDPRTIIRELCTRVMEHLDCQAFFNYLTDDETGGLRLHTSCGIPPALFEDPRWPDPAVCASAAHPRCEVHILALETSDQAELAKQLGFRACTCHPLRSGAHLLGTLGFATRTRDAFSPDDCELIHRVCDQIAIALERIHTARILQQNEHRFRTMANASPTMIWISDEHMQCTWVNTGWLDFVGRSIEEELGNGWLENVHPADKERSWQCFEQAFNDREPFEMEYRIRRSDDQYRWILARGTPLHDAGAFKGYVGSCVDVHARHLQRDQLENAVRERTAQLQDSVAELESFSYSIAHDMRAPLRAMNGFAKILTQEADSRLDPTHREYLRRIMTSAQRLDALIQDVLSYSRIARADLPLEPIATDEFIRDILVSYPDFSPARAQISIPEKLPPVLANRAALTQVVSNLLGNAVKFVAPGVFPVIQITGQANADQVRLSFSDNGIGIESEAQERIFKMFQRLHRNELYEGTGIGLAIVRKAMERMGGSVSIESRSGEGTTFHIYFKPATPL